MAHLTCMRDKPGLISTAGMGATWLRLLPRASHESDKISLSGNFIKFHTKYDDMIVSLRGEMIVSFMR